MALNSYVAVEVGTCVCALPIGHVVETMRALPLEPMANAPKFVAGLSIIRGVPVPVVDLSVVLGLSAGAATSLITLRMNGRIVAVRVDRVLGVRQIEEGASTKLPPLLEGASAEHVASIGTLDAHLLVILEASALFPNEVQAP